MQSLQARAQFKRRSTANNVEILVPVPEDADSPRFRTNIGSVHYAPEKSAIIWKIKQFGGGKEFLMRAELGLPSVKGDDEHGGGMTGGFGGSMGGAGQGGKGKRPISVKFEIPYFTTSGIQVRYLKIIEPKVSAVDSFRLHRGLRRPLFVWLVIAGCHWLCQLRPRRFCLAYHPHPSIEISISSLLDFRISPGAWQYGRVRIGAMILPGCDGSGPIWRLSLTHLANSCNILHYLGLDI